MEPGCVGGGRGIEGWWGSPYLNIGKFRGFLVSRFLGFHFVVFGLLLFGFLISKFQRSKLSKMHQIAISCFLADIDPVFKIVKKC